MGLPGKYADIILPLALSETYTFSIPEELVETVKTGHRVMVQFGRKRIYAGIVWQIHSNAPSVEVKPIMGILDDKPLINDNYRKFWEWLSEYYICTLGEVMKAALPLGLKLESLTKIHSLDDPELQPELNDLEDIALRFIRNNPGTTMEDLGKTLKRKNPLPLIKILIDKGLVGLEEFVNQRYKPKTQTILSLNPDHEGDEKLNAVLETLKRAPAQEKCLINFLDLRSDQDNNSLEIPIGDLLKENENRRAAINSLVKKSILIKYSLKIHFP